MDLMMKYKVHLHSDQCKLANLSQFLLRKVKIARPKVMSVSLTHFIRIMNLLICKRLN